eukprot:s2010_g4.t1
MRNATAVAASQRAAEKSPEDTNREKPGPGFFLLTAWFFRTCRLSNAGDSPSAESMELSLEKKTSWSFQSAAPKQTSFQLGLLFCETQTYSVSPASSRILFGQPEKSCKESNCFSGSSWQLLSKDARTAFRNDFCALCCSQSAATCNASQKEFTVQASVFEQCKANMAINRTQALMASI